MAQKFVHDVSPELTHGAQFTSVSAIPSTMLTSGATVRLWPGTYDAITTAVTDVTYEGIGDRDEVVVNGITVGNTSSGDLTVKNMTVNGSNSTAGSGVGAIAQTATDGEVNIIVKNAVLANADFGIAHQGTGAITVDNSDLTGVDRGILSNSQGTVTVAFSRLNTSSNAYCTPGGNAQLAITAVASTSGGSNTGNSVETVSALIS